MYIILIILLVLLLGVALAILYLNLRSKPKDENENKEAEEIANLKTEIVTLKDGEILKSEACMMISKSSVKKPEVKKLVKLLSKN